MNERFYKTLPFMVTSSSKLLTLMKTIINIDDENDGKRPFGFVVIRRRTLQNHLQQELLLRTKLELN